MKHAEHSSYTPSKLDGYIKYRNTSILFCIIVILTFLLFFRNNLKSSIYVEPQDTALYLNSYTGQELSVPYQDITSITLTDTFDPGTMLEGSDDLRVRSGLWQNSRFGEYQLFTLKKVQDYIIITTKDATIVFNYESTSVTDSIYEALYKLLEEKELSEQITFSSEL